MPRRIQAGPATPVAVVDGAGEFNSEQNPSWVRPVRWHYVGGEVITPGGASALATIPAGATIVEIAPEGEAVYFGVNAVLASTLSPGYVADGGRELIGPLDNLNSLAVYMAGVNIVHLMYFREA